MTADIADISPQILFLKPNSGIPNNPVLPVLIYHKIIEAQIANKAEVFQQHFVRSRWAGIWKNGIYDYHHFHPNAHEALGIARGHVEVQLGGKDGEMITLHAGDMIVLPAGTGHKCISASNLVVMGAYPEGQENYETCKAGGITPETESRIAATALPLTDPFYGDRGPLPGLWSKAIS